MGIQLAAAILRLPDGRFVFNHRAEDDVEAGGLIGLFSGSIEPGETPEDAIRRELGEETSLAAGKLVLAHLAHFKFPAEPSENHDGGTADIFLAKLPNDEFDVHKGGRVTLSYDQAIEHPELAPSLQALLPILMERMTHGA